MKHARKLYRAVTLGDVAAAGRLLDGGADPDAPAYGRTPLIRAIEAGQPGAAALLLGRGADPSVGLHPAYGQGVTPLNFAVVQGPGAPVRALIEAGADPEARDAKGRTPLMRAIRWGPIEAVRALLDRGVDLEAVAPKPRFTALCYAVQSPPRPPLVRLLLGRGADVQVRFTRRLYGPPGRTWTPLSLALETVGWAEAISDAADLRKARAVVRMLRAAGATE
jgi:uncharacterized protein